MAKKLDKRKEEFCKQLEKLEEVLIKDVSDNIIIDAILQRFEFTFTEACMLMNAYLEGENIINEVPSTKGATKYTLECAFEHKIINNINIWREMWSNRNSLLYTYDEETAVSIVNLVKYKYIIEFNTLKNFFKN